jgi:hypothetical protein
MSTTALEAEALGEFEEEFEFEGEAEWEGEDESEEFFRRLAGMARQAWRSPGALGRVARATARAVASGGGGIGAAIGGPQGSRGARVGGPLGSLFGRVLADLVPSEPGPQRQGELEWEANPIRRVYPDALMEHLGHRASQAESEAEAEAFAAALVPLAARAAPLAASAIRRASPQLVRGVVAATRTLRANPQTRPLVRTLPAIVQRTAGSIARQAASGQPVTPQQAVRTLAGQTARTLANPQRCAAAYQRSRALDRTYHRQVRAGGPRPCPTCAR